MTGRSEVSCNDGTFAVGAVAETPPAIIKDAPAAPNAGKVILRRFRFEARFACAMLEPFYRCGPIQPYPSSRSPRAQRRSWAYAFTYKNLSD